MRLERYRDEYREEVYRLFHDTVHTVCSSCYPKEALEAWATADVDTVKWTEGLLDTYSLIALDDDGVLLGFGSIDTERNYLDRLYVSSSSIGKGVGKALLGALEEKADGDISVYASDYALPFFQKHGYKLISGNIVHRNGIEIHNNLMKKPL